MTEEPEETEEESLLIGLLGFLPKCLTAIRHRNKMCMVLKAGNRPDRFEPLAVEAGDFLCCDGGARGN